MDMEWDGWEPAAWRRAVGSVGGGDATAQWPSAVETALELDWTCAQCAQWTGAQWRFTRRR